MSGLPAEAEQIWERYIAPNIEAARERSRHAYSRPLTEADYARMRRRFIEGHREHGGDILRRPKAWFAEMSQEERDDDAMYGAAEIGLFP